MADILPIDISIAWAQTGDVTAPDDVKVATGWIVEAPPRQYWNWLENRQDVNIQYLFQKGIALWDAELDYINNRSYVQHEGTVYKAVANSTGQSPSATTGYWVKAFPNSTSSSEALSGVTPAANTMPYFTSTTEADTTPLTAFARTILDDADAFTVRATISAQAVNSNLSALSGVTASTNGLPYFTSSTTMATTAMTALGRSVIGSTDAAGARSVLGVYSATEVDNISNGKQPLDATLTALAGVTTSANTLPYFTGVDTVATTALTAFARTLLGAADSAAATTALGAQPLDATLTGLAAISIAANQMIYSTGVDTFGTAPLSSFSRGLLGLSSDSTWRSSLGLGDAATRGTTSTGNVIAETGTTGAAKITKGTTAQRPAADAGLFRFNTDTVRFEGNNGTVWGALGGATGGGNDDAFYENTNTITSSYTISTGKNAGSFGPITIANGATVTVPTGSTWSIV